MYTCVHTAEDAQFGRPRDHLSRRRLLIGIHLCPAELLYFFVFDVCTQVWQCFFVCYRDLIIYVMCVLSMFAVSLCRSTCSTLFYKGAYEEGYYPHAGGADQNHAQPATYERQPTAKHVQLTAEQLDACSKAFSNSFGAQGGDAEEGGGDAQGGGDATEETFYGGAQESFYYDEADQQVWDNMEDFVPD